MPISTFLCQFRYNNMHWQCVFLLISNSTTVGITGLATGTISVYSIRVIIGSYKPITGSGMNKLYESTGMLIFLLIPVLVMLKDIIWTPCSDDNKFIRILDETWILIRVTMRNIRKKIKNFHWMATLYLQYTGFFNLRVVIVSGSNK